MKIQNPFDQIKFWRNAFELPVREVPTVPKLEEIDLAVRLVKEELQELQDALKIENPSEYLNEVADAVGDLFFVVSQVAYIHGLKPEELIEKVYESNMTKMCYSLIEVDKTIAFYKEKNIEAYYVKGVREGEFIVKRLSDNKVLKSINFVEPKWEYGSE